MARAKKAIYPIIKKLLGYPIKMKDDEFIKDWKERSRIVCKPCWELRYCPYGPLVEQFPLIPPIKTEMIEHNDYIKKCLRTGRLDNGKKLDPERRKMFERDIKEFNPADYPDEIPIEIVDTQCNVFGHICPIVFSAEAFTETSKIRRSGRYISFKTKVRVVRRDNYTCQHCKKHLIDNEVEFDHIIPVARGGSAEEHNIRLTCHDCNRDKSDKVNI